MRPADRPNSPGKRLAAAALVACIAGAASLIHLPGATESWALHSLPMTAERSQGDSVRVLDGAKRSLRSFHNRLRILLNTMPPMRPDFVCEKSVYPYCFGPNNGGVPFGGPRSIPVHMRTSESRVPTPLLGRVNGLVSDLLRDLDRAQKALPGDSWIVGQRVFQNAEQGAITYAQRVARECRSERWWCAALVGYASHLLNERARADSAFAVVAATLPGEELCRWENLADLVYDDPDHSWYVDLSCAERLRFNETLWWLADPLYIVRGNERRTEHYYRIVFARLFAESNGELPTLVFRISDRVSGLRLDTSLATGGLDCPFGDQYQGTLDRPMIPPPSCGSQDLNQPPLPERELWDFGALAPLMRSLGVPSYISIQRVPPNVEASERPQLLLQYAQPTYHFLPDIDAARSPMTIAADAWRFNSSTTSERYHPRFGYFSALAHQVAFFRRGEQARLIAAADIGTLEVLSAASNKPIGSALVLSHGPNLRDLVLQDTVPGTHVIFDSMVQPDSFMLSIEAMVDEVAAGRARFAAGPPALPAQRVAISDMLLVDRTDPLPQTLDEAAPVTTRGATVREGDVMGVYWEMYGLSDGDTVTYSLSAQELATSIVRRLGRIIGLSREPTTPQLRWTEPIANPSEITTRAFAINIADLVPARYRLRLDIQIPGQQRMTVVREFEVVERPAGGATPGDGS